MIISRIVIVSHINKVGWYIFLKKFNFLVMDMVYLEHTHSLFGEAWFIETLFNIVMLG